VQEADVDSHEVMDIFCRDEKLNLSSYYLKPGFAFGGSCLPEGRARAAVPRQGSRRRAAGDLADPAEQQAADSAGARQVLETGKKKIGLLGFSFKAGTDDLRESPIVILAEALLGKGIR
jgi:GDP-mannose 6-dehydrogenase